MWSQPSKNSGPGPAAPTLTHPPWKYQLYHFQDKFRLFQFSAMSGWWEKPSGSKISQVCFLEVLPLFTVLIVSLAVDAKSFLLLFHHLRSSLFIQFWKVKNKGLFAVTFHISLTNSSGTIEPISSQILLSLYFAWHRLSWLVMQSVWYWVLAGPAWPGLYSCNAALWTNSSVLIKIYSSHKSIQISNIEKEEEVLFPIS